MRTIIAFMFSVIVLLITSLTNNCYCSDKDGTSLFATHYIEDLYYSETISISRTGDYFAVGDKYGQIFIWETKTGKRISQLRKFSMPTVSQEDKEKLEILTNKLNNGDQEAYSELMRLSGSIRPVEDIVRSISFSNNQNYLAATSAQSLTVWDMMSKNELWSSSTRGNGWASVIFSGDDNFVISATNNCDIRGLYFSSGTELWSLNSPSSMPLLAISSDGSKILSGSRKEQGAILIWNAEKHDLIRELAFDQAPVSCASFSFDGKMISTGNNYGAVLIWEIPSYQRKDIFLKPHSKKITHISFVSSDSEVLTCSSENTLSVWNIDSAKQTSKIEFDGQLTMCQAVPASDGVIVFRWDGKAHVELWNYKTAKYIREYL